MRRERGRAVKWKHSNDLNASSGEKARQPVYSTQEDPIGLAGGLNLYGYAAGDPINNSDPFGLCPDSLSTEEREECERREDAERQAHEQAVAEQVGPRVADVRNMQAAVADQATDQGGAHAEAVGIVGGVLADLGIAGVVRAAQGPLDDQLRQAVGQRLRNQLAGCLDGDLGGDLAGVVAAHAVGEHEQADIGIEGNGVLVVLAHLACVRQADTP